MKRTLPLIPLLLNAQILDKDGNQCGKVDDIELTGAVGKPVKITAVLVGVSAWNGKHKGFVRSLIAKIAGEQQTIRIPWKDIAENIPTMRLTKKGKELGFWERENKLEKWLAKIPGGI